MIVSILLLAVISLHYVTAFSGSGTDTSARIDIGSASLDGSGSGVNAFRAESPGEPSAEGIGNDVQFRFSVLNYSFRLNRLPGVPTLNNPAEGAFVIYDTATLFTWNTTDLDANNVTYEFQLADTSAFADADLVVNTSLQVNTTTIDTSGNYSFTPATGSHPAGTYHWRVRATDNGTYSDYASSRSFEITYAALNISNPLYDEILNASSSVLITVKEIANGNWFTGVNLIVTVDDVNTTYAMTDQGTQFVYNYSVPNINSTFIDLKAVGTNGTFTVNDTSRFRLTQPEIQETSLEYLCGTRSVHALSSNTNVTLRANTGVLIDFVNVSIIRPDDTLVLLADYENNSANFRANNFSYEFNYSYTFPATAGTYQLRGEIRDVNYPRSSAQILLRNFTVGNAVATDLNAGTGISSIKLRDKCSGEVLESGTSISSTEPQGLYDLVAVTSDTNTKTIELFNVNITDTDVTVCSFTDIDETVTTPEDFRAIDQFDLSCNTTLAFTGVNLTYNYEEIVSSILTETALKVYKCDDRSGSSCTWQLLTSSVYDGRDNLTALFTNFSTFMIGEDLSLVQLPVLPTTVIESGGTKLGGDDPLILDLLQPGKITLFNNESIETSVILTNRGNTTLEDLQISANSDNENIVVEVDPESISSLSKDESREVALTITSLLANPGEHEVTVEVQVSSPQVFSDSAIFFIDLIAHDENIVNVAEKQLEFLTRLFEQNPKCKDFESLSAQAQEFFESENYLKALQFSDAAIQSCRNLVSSAEGVPLLSTLKTLDPNDALVLGIELLVVAIIVVLVYAYYRRHHLKQGNRRRR